MTNYPFSMRMLENHTQFLKSQGERLKLPITQVIRKLFDLNMLFGIPQRSFSLVDGNLTGDIWENLFTGLVRIQIIDTGTPVRAIEIEVKDSSFSQLKMLVADMLHDS